MSVMRMRLATSVSIMIMQAVVASVASMIICMLFAGYLFIVSVMFLITVTPVSRIIARAMAGTMRIVAISIGVVLSVSGM